MQSGGVVRAGVRSGYHKGAQLRRIAMYSKVTGTRARSAAVACTHVRREDNNNGDGRGSVRHERDQVVGAWQQLCRRSGVDSSRAMGAIDAALEDLLRMISNLLVYKMVGVWGLFFFSSGRRHTR